MLKLAEHFQSQLDAEQRSRWLELEEALLEHAARLHRSYFREGITKGFRRGISVQLRDDIAQGVAARPVVAKAVAGCKGEGSAGSGVASPGGNVAVRKRRRARDRRAGADKELPVTLGELGILLRKLQELLLLLRAVAEQGG